MSNVWADSGEEDADVRLVSVRVRNYRTIGATEQTLSLQDGLTIVGPNNSGKTNLLKAVQLLFTGRENIHGYSRDRDLTFGDRRVKTALLATFDGDDRPGSSDAHLYELLGQLHGILGSDRTSSAFSLSVQITESNNPVYQFFPNAKQPSVNALRTQFSRTQTQLVSELLDRFSCNYVPSARSVRELYEELMIPFLRATTARALQPHEPVISQALASVSQSFNDELSAAGLDELTVSFDLPGASLERLISGFDYMISDPERTPIFHKGQGIQSTALLAGFVWMTRTVADQGKSVIWLLEEPESYLHPQLSRAALRLLDRLRAHSLVVVTTHSLAFVPQDPKAVCGTRLDNRRTLIDSYSTYAEATKSLRRSLGVRFSDYYNLGRYNVLLEGKSDRELLHWFVDAIPVDTKPWVVLRAAELLDFGGVKHLSGFLRATYPIVRLERASVAVFDGDDAGQVERRSLQGYFGHIDVPFESGRQFVSVRNGFAVEALFPDSWIVELHGESPEWFETFSQDVSGELEPFRIRDSAKAAVQRLLVERATGEPDLAWASRWIALCDALERALQQLDKEVQSADQAELGRI